MDARGNIYSRSKPKNAPPPIRIRIKNLHKEKGPHMDKTVTITRKTPLPYMEKTVPNKKKNFQGVRVTEKCIGRPYLQYCTLLDYHRASTLSLTLSNAFKLCDSMSDGSSSCSKIPSGFRKRCYFMIKSKMHGKVLDIMESDENPGAEVRMYEANEGDNQLWYEDRHGNIYSKLNGLTIDCSKYTGGRERRGGGRWERGEGDQNGKA